MNRENNKEGTGTKMQHKNATRKCSMKMVIYEIRNLNGNFMTHFFGVIFPNIMSYVLSKTYGEQVSEMMRPKMLASIITSMALVIPMSIMFIGYGAVYSQEVEHEVPMRMRLFGFREGSLMTAKILAHLILMTAAIGIYAVFQFLTMDIPAPAASYVICLLVSLYLVGIIMLVIAHSLANIFRKFSITFGTTMSLFFVLMILTGMMGISTEQLPTVMQKIAMTLPMTYICNDFAGFWQGGSYNFMPFIQSMIFMGAIAGILAMYAQYRGKRELK